MLSQHIMSQKVMSEPEACDNLTVSYDENIPLLLANAAPFPSLFLDLPTMPRPISFLSFDPLERFHWCLHPIILLA